MLKVLKADGNIIVLSNAIGTGWCQWIHRQWSCEFPLMNLETGEDPNYFVVKMNIKRK